MTNSKLKKLEDVHMDIKRYNVQFIVYADSISSAEKQIYYGSGHCVNISLDEVITKPNPIGF